MTETVDLAIVGAGPAGLAAARVATEAGLEVCLLDDQPEAGGQIYRAVGHADRDRLEILGPDYAHGRTAARRARSSPTATPGRSNSLGGDPRAGDLLHAGWQLRLPDRAPHPAGHGSDRTAHALSRLDASGCHDRRGRTDPPQNKRPGAVGTCGVGRIGASVAAPRATVSARRRPDRGYCRDNPAAKPRRGSAASARRAARQCLSAQGTWFATRDPSPPHSALSCGGQSGGVGPDSGQGTHLRSGRAKSRGSLLTAADPQRRGAQCADHAGTRPDSRLGRARSAAGGQAETPGAQRKSTAYRSPATAAGSAARWPRSTRVPLRVFMQPANSARSPPRSARPAPSRNAGP